MIDLTREEREALHLKYGARKTSFYGELLDRDGLNKGIRLTILNGQIDVNTDYDVIRSGRVIFEDISQIDLMSDRIQLYMVVNDKHEWPLGIYMIMDNNLNELMLADETVKLKEARVDSPKVFYKGSLYTEALEWFIVEGANSVKVNIQPSTLKLSADIIVDDSKPLIKWFNSIADQINYVHLYIDEDGYYTSRKYEEASLLNVGYTYLEDNYSVITDPSTSKIDTYNVPNSFKCIVSRGDIPPLVSIYKNDDPSNKFSIPYRKLTISKTEVVENIASQEELDLYTSRLALKARTLEETKTITTATMPHHQTYDIIELEDGVYEEEGYYIELSFDGEMKHYLRRVVYGFEGIRPNSAR